MRMTDKHRRMTVVSFLVVIALLFCVSPATAQWENRGDLNLNGIPFELLDAAIFAGYFANGLLIFTIDIEAQIAATDINMDGITLSVADYVMMIRIEMGAGDPPPADPDTFAVSVIYDYGDTSVIVSARFDRIPASMYLEFDFAAQPTYNARLVYGDGPISMGTAGAGKALAMLVTGMNSIPSNGDYIPLVELAYQGDPPTKIAGGVLGAEGDQGNLAVDTTYTAGDANHDITVNIGDAVYIINYIFKGGTAPSPLVAGDANCDETINVGDAVYIVNYIFKGGPAPGCR